MATNAVHMRKALPRLRCLTSGSVVVGIFIVVSGSVADAGSSPHDQCKSMRSHNRAPRERAAGILTFLRPPAQFASPILSYVLSTALIPPQIGGASSVEPH